MPKMGAGIPGSEATQVPGSSFNNMIEQERENAVPEMQLR